MATYQKSYKTASGKSVSDLLAQYGAAAANSLARGLYVEAQGIIESSAGLVPVDTNTLRSSRYVKPPEITGTHLTVVFGYGGAAANINPKTGESADSYALYVHENLEAFHKTGVAKFLELPFNQASRGMDVRLAEHIRNDLKKAGYSPPTPEVTE